jgi:hypothetical protein
MRRIVLAAVVALVLAGSALASRAPTFHETQLIGRTVKGYIAMPKSPAAKDNQVVGIEVSTVDARYADVHLSSKSAGPSEMVVHESGSAWWVVDFGSSLGCDTAPASVLDDLNVGCTPPSGVAWINNCGPLVDRPVRLVLACGDGNYYLDGLRWRGWGKTTATATGKAVADDCTPYCAAGHFHSYRMTATVTRLTLCGAAHYYSRIAVVYPGARPAGVAGRDLHTLPC